MEERLAQAIRDMGLTQKEFGTRCGVSGTMIWKIVQGHAVPGIDLACAIERETEGAIPPRAWAAVEVWKREVGADLPWMSLARFLSFAGMSQAEMSRRCGVGPMTIWELVNDRKRPSLNLACTIERHSSGMVPVQVWSRVPTWRDRQAERLAEAMAGERGLADG